WPTSSTSSSIHEPAPRPPYERRTTASLTQGARRGGGGGLLRRADRGWTLARSLQSQCHEFHGGPHALVEPLVGDNRLGSGHLLAVVGGCARDNDRRDRGWCGGDDPLGHHRRRGGLPRGADRRRVVADVECLPRHSGPAALDRD